MSTFIRLLTFLRPYRVGVLASLVLAALAMAATVAIPWLTGRAIDQIDAGDRSGLQALAGGVVLVAVLRLGFSVARRLVAGRVSLGVEVELRDLVYAHLQRLELGFFDGQQTGQLMSRATVDLQSVRFFLGYGLVFIAQSAISILLAAVAMIVLQPGLALLALAPVPFVVVIAARYGRRSRPALQEVQQRIAELTAEAEENVSGVRVVKAFAAEQRQLARFRAAVGRVFDQSMRATHLRAFYNPFLAFLPNLGLAVVLLVGGRRVIAGDLTLGGFTAFYAYVLLMIGPMRDARHRARARPAGDRVGRAAVRGARPRPAPRVAAGRPGAAARARRRRAARGDPRVRRRAAVAARRRPHDRRGHDRGARGRHGLGQDDARRAPARLYDVTEGAVLIDGADVREVDLPSWARGRGGQRRPVPVLGHGPRQHRLRPAGGDSRGGRRGRRRPPRRPGSSPSCRRASTRSWASAGSRCRAASASGSRSPARCWPTRGSSCSTTRRRPWTPRPSSRSRPRCGWRLAGRTTFVIAHRLSTIALADDVIVLEGGRVAARGTHAELLTASPLYAEIAAKGLPDQVFLNRERREAVAGL